MGSGIRQHMGWKGRKATVQGFQPVHQYGNQMLRFQIVIPGLCGCGIFSYKDPDAEFFTELLSVSTAVLQPFPVR